jgi:hypothetical protein
MDLTSFTELNATREKLLKLETLYADQERTPGENPFVKERSQQSLKRLIHQLREEIARFEARAYRPDLTESSNSPEPSMPSPNRE